MPNIDEAVSEAVEAWNSHDVTDLAEFDNFFRLWKGLKDQPPINTDLKAMGVNVYPSYTCALAGCLWLEDKSQVIYDAICIGFDGCAKLYLLGRDEVSAILRLTDLLLAYFKLIPAATLGTYILKSGLRNFCGCKSGLPNYNKAFFTGLTRKYLDLVRSPQPSALYKANQWLDIYYADNGDDLLAVRRLKEAESYVRVAKTGFSMRALNAIETASELNEIGFLYIELGDPKEADRILSEALRLNSKATELLESMAWLRYNQGRYEEARQYMERALADEGECLARWGINGLQESRYHFVCILTALGDRDKANGVVARMREAGDMGNQWLLKALARRAGWRSGST